MLRTAEGKELDANVKKVCPYGYFINFSDGDTRTLGTNINICVTDGSATDVFYDIVQELWNLANREKFRAFRENPPKHEGRPDGLRHAINLELLERGAAAIYVKVAPQLGLKLSSFVEKTQDLTWMAYIEYMIETNREHFVAYAREVDKDFEGEIVRFNSEAQ